MKSCVPAPLFFLIGFLADRMGMFEKIGRGLSAEKTYVDFLFHILASHDICI